MDIGDLIELNGSINTKVICNETKTRVYEIIREFDYQGDEILLITLYPTISSPYMLDLSTMHMINHAGGSFLKWSKIHFLFLFSTVAGAKLSTRNLTVDEDNLDYIRKVIQENASSKIVISYGASMDKCPAAIKSKVELFKIIKELRPDEALWQISAYGMEEEAPHILFAGIRYGTESWSLSHYVIPYRFTPEGYESYLSSKQEARERFVKNVLEAGKRNKAKKEPVTDPDEGSELDETPKMVKGAENRQRTKRRKGKNVENEESN